MTRPITTAPAYTARAMHAADVEPEDSQQGAENMNDSIATILDTARRIANTDLYPARCRSVITDLANALQTVSVELTETREYALALERELADRSEKQDAFTAMVSSMDADFEMTNASLAGCKIALEQAWASSRERAVRITALTEAPKLKKCPACNGRGYHRCDCWPADCICGWGDETCEECGGDGYFDPDEYPDEDAP